MTRNRRFRSFTTAPVSAAAIATALWGVAVVAIWAPVDARLLPPDRAAAVTLTILAATVHGLRRLRDRDKDALVHALADITLRRGLAQTRPLKRVV